MPFATLAETIVTASVTLVAVCVGALLSARVQIYVEGRRDRGQARAAAWLVRDDLAAAQGFLMEAVTRTHWAPWFDARVTSWDSSRRLLAGQLSAPAWARVAGVVAELSALDLEMRERQQSVREVRQESLRRLTDTPKGAHVLGVPLVSLDQDEVTRVEAIRAKVAAAMRPIEGLAGEVTTDVERR